jgi:hypothetical protein
MKLKFLLQLTSVLLIGILSSCTTMNHSMREPNTRVDFQKEDFTLSEQVSAQASSTKIIGIDFARIFTSKTGTLGGGAIGISLASIPVLGNYAFDRTTNYSLYELMKANPGYDVVFYPQYETKIVKPILGIGFITKKTTVKTTARLGKLNK